MGFSRVRDSQRINEDNNKDETRYKHFLLHIYFVLFAITPLACNMMTETSSSSPTIVQTETLSNTTEIVDQAIDTPTESAKPSETPLPAETPTSLPTFVMPPTPAPPSEEWFVFVSADTGLNFKYPANWFVYSEDNSYINVTNFRLDGMPLKGYTEEKAKIDISKLAIDLSEYASLSDYLDAPDQQPSDDDPGEILNQIELTHEMNGYEIIRQTFSGFMGLADETYEKIYVASNGKAIRIMVFAKQT